MHTRHIGSSQHQRVLLTLGRRHDHDDVLHTGHMGGNGVHQHARRIGRLAARHVNAHAIQRRDLLAQQRAVLVTVAPALAIGLLLRFVVAAHTACRRLQRFALGSRQAVEGGFQLLLGQLQRRHGIGLQAVKACRVFQHGVIAAGLDIGQDVGDPLLDGCIRVRRPVQTLREIMLELGINC